MINTKAISIRDCCYCFRLSFKKDNPEIKANWIETWFKDQAEKRWFLNLFLDKEFSTGICPTCFEEEKFLD